MQRYTTKTPRVDGTSSTYGFYCFGKPTLFDALRLAKTVEKTFNGLASFFDGRMTAGRLLVPATSALGPDFERVPEDREQYPLGFAEQSLTKRIFSGLEEGSRAAQAGLRNGDIIVRSTFMFESVDHFART